MELRPSTVTRGRYRGDDAIEVVLDGERVGELTSAMSRRYRHLVGPGGTPAVGRISDAGSRELQIDLRLPAMS